MKINKMIAAILVEQKMPLTVDSVNLPNQLKLGQVLVKIHYSGICGSQIGEINGVKGKDNFLPHLLGHEGSATVLEIGPGVKNIKVDDVVVLHWRKGLGLNSDAPNYSLNGKIINAGWVTTFNEYAIVSENRCTKISKKSDLKLAALFGCAITTAFGVVENNAALKIGESVVVYGSGGIGLNIIQAAKIVGAHPIIAVDQYENRLELASEMGATKTFNSKKINFSDKEIRSKLFNGLDVFIDNTGVPEIIEMGYSSIKDNGRLVLVGVPKINRNINIFSLPMHFGKKIIGSHGGNGNPSEDIPRYHNYFKRNKIDLNSLITEIISINNINEAISDMQSGKLKGRCLIKF